MDVFDVRELSTLLQQDLDDYRAHQARARATNHLRDELGVEFGEAARTLTERIPATRTYQHLPAPLVSVQSVTVNGTALADLTDYEQTKRGIVCPDGFGAHQTANWVTLVVEFTAGFDTVPTDLHDAALHLAGLAYMHARRVGVKSSTITVEGVSEAETYVTDDDGARDPMTLDPGTYRALRARYGSARPRTGSVLLR